MHIGCEVPDVEGDTESRDEAGLGIRRRNHSLDRERPEHQSEVAGDRLRVALTCSDVQMRMSQERLCSRRGADLLDDELGPLFAPVCVHHEPIRHPHLAPRIRGDWRLAVEGDRVESSLRLP